MRYVSAVLLAVSLLVAGCAGKKIFTFQNAPGHVQIPGDWKDATTPGKSKATSPDGKAWVAMASIARPPQSMDIKTLAEMAWNAQNVGAAAFEPVTVNGLPAAVGVVPGKPNITVVCVCQGKLKDRLLLVIATGEGVSESTMRKIVTSYQE